MSEKPLLGSRPTGLFSSSSVSFSGVVAAGGYARRLGGNVPKCLLTVEGVPLIRQTVRGIADAGCSPILVCVDREEWLDDVRRALVNVSPVVIFRDRGYKSTYLLASYLRPVLAPRFLFAYGHAPHSVEHIVTMMSSSKAVVATGTRESSRRDPIALSAGLFAEPPFLVNADLLDDAETWRELFALHPDLMEVVPRDGPSEFNTKAEFRDYAAYLVDRFKPAK